MMMMMMMTLPSVCYVITCNFYLCLRKHTSDTFWCWREAPWVVCCSSCVYLTPPNGNCRNQELFARVYFILAQDPVRLPPAMIYWANGMKEWTNVATLPGHELACYIIFFIQTLSLSDKNGSEVDPVTLKVCLNLPVKEIYPPKGLAISIHNLHGTVCVKV